MPSPCESRRARRAWTNRSQRPRLARSAGIREIANRSCPPVPPRRVPVLKHALLIDSSGCCLSGSNFLQKRVRVASCRLSAPWPAVKSVAPVPKVRQVLALGPPHPSGVSKALRFRFARRDLSGVDRAREEVNRVHVPASQESRTRISVLIETSLLPACPSTCSRSQFLPRVLILKHYCAISSLDTPYLPDRIPAIVPIFVSL